MSNPLPRSKYWVVLAVAMVLCIGMTHAATKSTLVFAKQAKSKGEIVFGITPQGGETTEITITVVAKMGANEVAAAVSKEFTFTLSEQFKISQSGAKVTIKPIEKKATFELEIINQTVQGISVTIK